jgi:hypothetical protein
MKTYNIFNPYGSVNRTPITYTDAKGQQVKNVSFITLSEAGGDNIVLGYAPITGVKIRRLTDYSVTKSLDDDFLVATFGDTPTSIVISGMNFFNINGCELSGDNESKAQIMDFYENNKISTDKTKRFDVAIANSKSSTVGFRCVIVGLDLANESRGDGLSNVMYNYTMQLIGVKR